MTHFKKFSSRIIMLPLAMVLLMGSMGCVGYVDGGPGVVAVDTGPDFWYGGGYDHGRDVHGYSHRGAVSRGVAHGGGHVGGGRR